MSVTLYCADAPGLKLGPGTASYGERSGEDFIVFVDGFAEVPELTDKYKSWIDHPGTPTIVIAEQGQSTSGFDCEVCGKSFGTRQALGGHKLAHVREAKKGN